MDTWHEGKDQTEHAARLCQFLVWQISITAGTALLTLLIFLFEGGLQSGLIAAICTVYVGVLLWARQLAQRQHLTSAIGAISGGLFVIGLVDVLVVPAALLALMLLPLLAVVIALPYLRGKHLRRLLYAAGPATTMIMLLAYTVRLLPPLPQHPVFPIIIGSGPIAIIVLILVLLWQYHTYLVQLLARLQSTNTALQHSQANLEAQVQAHRRATTRQRPAYRLGCSPGTAHARDYAA